ncbi:MAG TPA: peptidoglycan-binding protein, partial [Candidatus Paceibacterota bacterium]
MKYIAALCASIITLLPGLASADQLSDLQAQILLLSQQLAQLQQQQASGTTSGSCVTITVPIGPGSTGSNVTVLQQFLAKDRNMYPEGQVTGYYGTLTTTAVQRFQAKYNIVSSGSPSTTGYG